VQFRFEFGTNSLSPQLAANHLYAGKRVLYTLSKDNDLRWIIDWIRFHVRNHGANAVLLYDNASTKYSGEELERSLRQAFPQLEVNVVQWPYKYGPQGLSRDSGWDSDFCQAGAFHDARFRFLDRASSVLNCDIDELVVSSNGGSIFEATEKARNGCLVFGGHWLSNAIDERRDKLNSWSDVRHSYFKYAERSTSDPCPNKWCVVPGRCDIKDQWRTHSILGKDSTACHTRIFSYRHFRSVSTNWKYQRSRSGPFDPHLHKLDNALDIAFMRAGLAPIRSRPPQLLSRLARQINPSRKQKSIKPLKQSVPVKVNDEKVESNVALLAVDPNDSALGGNMIGGDPQTYHPELWSYLIKRFSVKTVLDVGCGEGHCVQYCSALGVNAVGFDGLKRNIECAVVPIVHHDLRSAPFILPVDLVLCCEVVEHIEEKYLPNLLRTLANGRVIAMTHAVPGQTGYHHVNLQPSNYWIKNLEALGYEFLRNETEEGKRRIIAGGRWTYFVSSGLIFEHRQTQEVTSDITSAESH
jgi:SAM-dependent methyltransferase